jgi:peptidoglycan/xylan/chitin deacetylase (PgdA/CDA1 family)
MPQNYYFKRSLPLLALMAGGTAGCHTHLSRQAAVPKPAVKPASYSVPLDLTKVQPNEAGQVPILEYHNLIASEKFGGYEYPAAEFRKDMEWLYAHKYRPIALADYAQGKIDCPAGMSPVILTFDDALVGQFIETAPGKVSPNCAVGILEDMHVRHPDWPLKATFFVLTDEDPKMPKPFTVPHDSSLPDQNAFAQEKMTHLVQDGFEIGNHTLHHHMGMQRMSDAEVEREFAGGFAGIHHYLPGYAIQTLALPYGVYPRSKKLVISGQSGGVKYHHVCAMEAGWYPAPSPLSKAFKPYAIPRIIPADAHTQPGSLNTIRYWLGYLEAHKSEKFVSDGDPSTYTVAASKLAQMDRARLRKEGFRLRDYTGTHLAADLGHRFPS